MDSLKRRVLALTIIVGLAVVVGGGLLAFDPIGKEDGSAKACAKNGDTNLTPRGKPAWALAKPQGAKLAVALAYHVGEPRRASSYVKVKRMGRGGAPALPRGSRVGAFVLGGGLSDGTQGMGFAPVAVASRARDGRSVRVALCVERPTERDLSAPGTYTGKVRVAGPRLRPVDVPVSVSIKGNLIEPALVAIFVAILGALAPFTTRPEEADEEDIKKHQTTQRVLAWFPFVSGVLAGLLAAFLIYADDPTWGLQRGSDTFKLVVATYAAASAGLAASALPTKAARRGLARPAKPAKSTT